MTAPTVSVLMPVRNGGVWLHEAVASVCQQTRDDWELVLVDDHSTDTAVAAVPTDPRVRVIRNAGHGLVAALNTGLVACRAPFMARLDADDRMHPERLAHQCAAFAANPSLTVVASRVRSFSTSAGVPGGMRRYLAWQNRLVGHADIVDNAFVEAPLVHPSVMLRTAALRTLGGYRDCPWAEDFDLWLRGRAAGWRFGKLRRTLTEWRDHGARLTRTDARCARDRYIDARAHHLAASEVQGRDVAICGGGKHAVRLCRALRAHGVTVSRFYDIAPRRVGGLRQGVPVLPLSALLGSSSDRVLVLGCVARPEARRDLRLALLQSALHAGRDWLLCA
ncbi:MAG: glycosyltransferase [Pseudomonadota bacterium]